MLNKAMIIGSLGSDVEVKQGANTAYARFSVATSKKKRDNSGEYETHWHNCVVFGKNAEYLGRASKGDRVYIEGEITYSEYEKDGRTIRSMEVLVNSCSVVQTKNITASGGRYEANSNAIKNKASQNQEDDSDSLPF